MSDISTERPQFTLRSLLIIVAVIGALLAGGTPWVRWMAAHEGRPYPWPLVVAVLVGTPILVIWLGRYPLRTIPAKTAVIAEALSHGIGLVGLVASVYALLPPFVKILYEFKVALPAPTHLLVKTHQAATRWTDLAMPLVILLLAIDVGVFSVLYASPARKRWARIWSAGVTALLLTTMVACFLAVMSPLTIIIQRLTG